MKYPHPLVAVVARGGIWMAAASLGLTVVIFLYQPHAKGWYGLQTFESWSQCKTASDVGCAIQIQTEGILSAVVPSVSLMLSVGLLRVVATGRMQCTFPAGGLLRTARTPAAGAMWLAMLAVGTAAGRWAVPAHGASVGDRVTAGMNDATLCQPYFDPITSAETSFASRMGREASPAEPAQVIRRGVIMATVECRMLLAAVQPSCLLLALFGVIYCVGRPDPDTNT